MNELRLKRQLDKLDESGAMTKYKTMRDSAKTLADKGAAEKYFHGEYLKLV